jgi:hypothetical protein
LKLPNEQIRKAIQRQRKTAVADRVACGNISRVGEECGEAQGALLGGVESAVHGAPSGPRRLSEGASRVRGINRANPKQKDNNKQLERL